ncbi:6-phospho-beta-glucosidase [Tissierella praeacuta]|uniref:6-phospho-beta-glucosidase n=1 Tax=Tissierella praeacuta TaxID=43131 RepID=UPI00333E82C3
MNKSLKIGTIGGGSSYTPEFLEGLINRYDELPVDELWLVDIEERLDKLEIIGELGRRMIDKANIPMKIFTTTDRKKAIKDADFVTTQIRVGLLKSRVKDERIPLSYGFIGQETNGAGGLINGLRTIPVILEIADEMKDLCPDAWLINFTNPVGMVTEALARYSKHRKFVGLCNTPVGIERGIAKILDIDHSRIRIDFAGLNHMIYGFNTFIDNEDKTAEVFEEFIKNSILVNMKNIEEMEWDEKFSRALNLIPCPYHKYYYKQRDMLESQLNQYKNGSTRAEEVIKTESELFNLYKNPKLNTKPIELEKRGGAYYSDAACNLISSIYNDKGDLQVVNTINRDTIKDFPSDYAIEITSYITKDGPIPHKFIDEFPVSIKGLINQIKTFEVLGAESAVEGNYEKALLAMTLNPLVANDMLGHRLLDEMLEVNRKYLPRFYNKEFHRGNQ